MVPCFDERLCKAEKCSLAFADNYVKLANKGRNGEQEFNNLMMLNAYMETLERYAGDCERKKLDLHCLCPQDIEKIFDQVSILCGGCSCNCND